MAFNTLPAGPGVELSYIDSGAPSTSPYTTIVGFHGMCFTNLIYERLKTVALNRGVRFVSMNRRQFPGSTPFTEEEFNVTMNGGTEEQKDAQIQARGHEIATFTYNFIQKNNLPPISKDGKTGGIVFLGWSLGAIFALAAVAHSSTLPAEVQARLGSHIRSLILYDTSSISLGLPMAEQNWTPLVDTTMPEADRFPVFGQWCTSYFDHGDLTKRDLNSLSWVVPSTNRVPTVYTIPPAQLKEMERYGTDGISDLFFLIHFGNQLKAAYRKSFYDPETLKAFPKMRLTFLAGERSGAFAISALWAIQDDEKEAGGERAVNYKTVPGINHFWHWDEPEKAFEGFMSCA